MRSVAVLLISLFLAQGAFAESAWSEDKGIAVHIATGLPFPSALGDLQRSPLGPSTNPYAPGAVSVSYGAQPAQLLVMLIPAKPGPESDPAALLEARFQVLSAQIPSARVVSRGRTSLVCSTNPVEFSELRIAFPEGEHRHYGARLNGYLVLIQARGAVGESLLALTRALAWPCHSAA